jgi:transcriptional regulator with XRE-family HTH domain
MTPPQIKRARQLLGCTQNELAQALGWTSPRNVVKLEHPTAPKHCTTQTALSIECLLRRIELWDYFKKAENITS